jgi:ribonuclease HI
VNLRIYIDGAARGNPGPGGAGIFVTDETGKPIKKFFKSIAHCTNNIAEAAALEAAVQIACKLGAERVDIFTDSQLLARQFTGQYRVKNPGLQEAWARIRREMSALPAVTVTHIPREQNKEADRLANLGADKAGNL